MAPTAATAAATASSSSPCAPGADDDDEAAARPAEADDEGAPDAEAPGAEEAQAPWQLLNFVPLPHGHGEFAFTLGIARAARHPHGAAYQRCVSSGAQQVWPVPSEMNNDNIGRLETSCGASTRPLLVST